MKIAVLLNWRHPEERIHFNAACEAAAAADAELVLITAVESLSKPIRSGRINDTVKKLNEANGTHAEEDLNMFAELAKEKGVNQVSTAVVNKASDAKRELVGAIGELDIDHVFMATRNRSALKRLFLGSFSNYMVNHAPCTVTVVRDKGDAKAAPTMSRKNSELKLVPVHD